MELRARGGAVAIELRLPDGARDLPQPGMARPTPRRARMARHRVARPVRARGTAAPRRSMGSPRCPGRPATISALAPRGPGTAGNGAECAPDVHLVWVVLRRPRRHRDPAVPPLRGASHRARRRDPGAAGGGPPTAPRGGSLEHPTFGTGADILASQVLPAIPAVARIAAAHVAMVLFPWWVAKETPGAWEVVEDAEQGLRVTDRRSGTETMVRGEMWDGDPTAGCGSRFDSTPTSSTSSCSPTSRRLDAGERSARRSPLRSFPPTWRSACTPSDSRVASAVASASTGAAARARRRWPTGPRPAACRFDLLELEGASVPFDAQTRFGM